MCYSSSIHSYWLHLNSRLPAMLVTTSSTLLRLLARLYPLCRHYYHLCLRCYTAIIIFRLARFEVTVTRLTTTVFRLARLVFAAHLALGLRYCVALMAFLAQVIRRVRALMGARGLPLYESPLNILLARRGVVVETPRV